MGMMKNIRARVRQYCEDTRGAIAILFALMAPVMIGSAGMALDYAQAYLVQQRLAQAIDAAALAASASSSDPTEIEQRVKDFFDVNYPPEKLGATFEPVVLVKGDEVIVTGEAYYHTTFLRLLGIEELDVDAETVVQRQVQGIEVVLVMDNTGSMATRDRIGTLRTAATNFVNILFDRTSNPNYIRIGLVPYSTSVNVGYYGLGKNPDGTYYDVPFVNNPNNLNYTTNQYHATDWFGCVKAKEYPIDTEDSIGSWDMYRFCRDENDVSQCRARYCNRSSCWYEDYVPNYICPKTPLMPLNNDRDALLASIGTMQADGHTYGNFGLVWGYRLLTPEYPFQEASDWDDIEWRKVAVMMTDGVNTMHNLYSAYGLTSEHNLNAGDLDDRMAEVCENMKEDGILLYTITFDSGVSNSTKELFRECATSDSNYYDAPDQEDLINVFETISRELSNLHIKS